MSHNNIALISIIIVALIGVCLATISVNFIFEVESIYKDATKFIISILIITTFYAPLKTYLIKKIKVDDEK